MLNFDTYSIQPDEAPVILHGTPGEGAKLYADFLAAVEASSELAAELQAEVDEPFNPLAQPGW